MRIIKYKDEIVHKCPHCETEFAYVKKEISTYGHGQDSVDTVKGFLKWAMSDKNIFNQLTAEQYKELKKHPNWVCYSNTIERSILCPACKKYIELTPILEFIEIYPEGSDFDGGEVHNDTNESFYWDDFIEI